jgi:cysteine desulfurase / selenocysteine lyase
MPLETVRADFPILATTMNGKPLIYFDNGATTQKPQAVIDAIVHYYRHDNANVHRGLYELSQRATDAYEQARAKVAQFLGNVLPNECIFTRGTTEGINLVASSWGRNNLRAGDQVLLSGLEHHSNIVPWQFACQATGAEIVVVHPESNGALDLKKFKQALSNKVRMVAIQHTSNALGTIHDIQSVVAMAKAVDAKVLVDGAQGIAHAATRLPELGCDFFVFSGHKLYGPTGIGVLWGRKELLESMPPFMGGGDMIDVVTFEKTTFAGLPNRFEAGTPHIEGAVGLAAAIDYVNGLGFDNIAQQESALLQHATEQLRKIPGLQIIGDARPKTAIISFVMKSPDIASMDVASYLALEGIAIRTGHHCCMPLMQDLGVSGTCRVSMAFYNTLAEVDKLAEVLNNLVQSRTNKQFAHQAAANAMPAAASAVSDSNNIQFGRAQADSPDKVAEELIDEFLAFDDQHSKTQLLLEFGQELPDAFGILKTLTTSVPGCMSEVYLIGRSPANDPTRIEFAGDSNAQIVRGLIGVLQKLYSGQKATDVLAFDVEDFFRTIGLDQIVTSQRRSGLAGMLARIRGLAQSVIDSQPS